METKSCSNCGITKPKYDFPTTRRVCKNCRKTLRHTQYINNKFREQKLMRLWRKQNPNKGIEYSKRYRLKHKNGYELNKKWRKSHKNAWYLSKKRYYQKYAIKNSYNRYCRWTLKEMDMVLNSNLSDTQISNTIHRSLAAVQVARWRFSGSAS